MSSRTFAAVIPSRPRSGRVAGPFTIREPRPARGTAEMHLFPVGRRPGGAALENQARHSQHIAYEMARFRNAGACGISPGAARGAFVLGQRSGQHPSCPAPAGNGKRGQPRGGGSKCLPAQPVDRSMSWEDFGRRRSHPLEKAQQHGPVHSQQHPLPKP